MRGDLTRISAFGICAVAALAISQSAAAQPVDTILVNGKIVTADERGSTGEAVAVREGRITAVGSSAAIRALAGPNTRVIDLRNRTVIPGLIDSHMHAIRAALSYATEVNWIGAASLDEALRRLREGARAAKPGAWLIVAGGWTPDQFKEKRRPTQAELTAAAPENPVYVQLFYEWVLLNPRGLEMLGIRGEADLPAGGVLERDAEGRLTGGITGSAITQLFARLPTPDFAQMVEGTVGFFRELNRLALTGVVDPGGFNMSPASYQPLFRVWRDRRLTVRVAYNLFAQNAGAELQEFQALTPLLPMGFGDEMLRFNGIGERVTFGMYNNDSPTPAQKQQLYEAARWAAGQGMALTMHWGSDRSAGELLEVFERVNRETPIGPLRWFIAHLNDATPRTLERMNALGIGWTMQDAMYFDGDRFLKQRGADEARRTPPLQTAVRMGVRVGAGTDAHRVMSYNPFTSLQWILDGKTVSGTQTRGADETPTRLDALRMYTVGSAWFAHAEDRRGTLETGKLADLAVLSKDYLTMPVEEIGGLESVLTMVGGKIVFATGEYATLEEH